MIADLKPYPRYQESKLPWAGSIPSHWNIKRGKALFKESQLAVRDGDEIVTCFRDGQVTLRRNRRTSGFMMALYEAGYQGVRKGQLVIHAMDAFAGAVGVSESDGKCTPEYIVADPRADSALAGYFALLLRFAAHQGFILVSCPAVRERAPRFRYPDFGNMDMLLPPAAEQAAIVRFLDWANGRLERAIRAKRKVIALLNEQKQAIIHRAVTRGLDPSVPLKPSGIPWLGDIPQHWEVMRTKFLAHIKTGGRDTVDRIDGAPYPFFVRSQTVERIDTYSFDGEAVLTAGDGAGVAKVFHYIDAKFDYHQRVYKFSNFKQVSGRFFFLYLKSTLRFEALDASAKSTVDSLRLPLLQNFPTLVPPSDEQLAIVRAVATETAGLDTVMSRVAREIELLREYRTRLVADVVTGKLDVRAAAARLPEETDEPERLDDEETGDADLDAMTQEAEA
jgi:type I restriction enzyme S subunit